jgi:hypothetical protein
MKSSNLALRLDGAECADGAPDAQPCDAAPRVDALARQRARFDYRAFDQREFDRRTIVVGAQGFTAFRVS